jgi:hypothetical protein
MEYLQWCQITWAALFLTLVCSVHWNSQVKDRANWPTLAGNVKMFGGAKIFAGLILALTKPEGATYLYPIVCVLIGCSWVKRGDRLLALSQTALPTHHPGSTPPVVTQVVQAQPVVAYVPPTMPVMETK